MHSFLFLSQILANSSSYVHFKTLVEFALYPGQKAILIIQIWDIFCGACSQWGALASILRKGRHFLITNVIPSIDCKIHKRCPG